MEATRNPVSLLSAEALNDDGAVHDWAHQESNSVTL